MSRFDPRQFAVLLVAGLVAYGLGLPYSLALAPLPVGPTIGLLLAAFVQTGVLLVVALAVGQYFGRPVGLGTPLLDDLLSGVPVGDRVRSMALLAIPAGVAVGVALIVVDLLLAIAVGSLAVAGLPPLWTRFLAIFYGGVFEELLLRFGLMTVLVWTVWKVARTPQGEPNRVGVWAAIVVSSILFGLGHLPIAVASGLPIDAFTVGRSLLLNGIAGIVFGWLYWRRGLEAAMLAHLAADFTLHVVGLSVLAAIL